MKIKEDFISLGFNNVVSREKVVSIVNAQGKPIKRLINSAKNSDRLIDATCGRKTRSVIITDSNHIILSGLQPQTLIQKLNSHSRK